MSKPFFLAKAGQTYGPFDREEIEALRESGDYENYTWFWDQAQARWQPIDPPPAPPRMSVHNINQPPAFNGDATAQAPQASKSQPEPVAAQEQHSAWSVPASRLKSISAICHDQQNVVSGTLANVTDAGCEFLVSNHSTSPDFQAKLPVLLHLLDLGNGHSMNVSGRLGRIERRDGMWVYRIHWKRCPQLLIESGSSAHREAKV